MRRRHLIVGLLAAVAITASPAVIGGQSQSGRGIGDEEVLRVVRQFQAAALKPDTAFLSALFAEDITHFHPGSPYRYVGRERLTKEFAQFPQRATNITFEMIDPRVQVVGENVAIVTYYISETWMENGTAKAVTEKATEVYVRRGSDWSMIHSHYSGN